MLYALILSIMLADGTDATFALDTGLTGEDCTAQLGESLHVTDRIGNATLYCQPDAAAPKG